MSSFTVGFVLFPDLTELDLTGPLQVLARLPQSRTVGGEIGKPCPERLWIESVADP